MLYLLFIFIAIVVSALLTWVYLLPGRIALNKNHHQTGLVMSLNIALGWTLFVWLGLFIWSLTMPRAS